MGISEIRPPATCGVAFVVLTALIIGLPLHAETGIVPRALLIEDARQLLDTIEETHPDPYFAGGGRVAFHRRFQEMLGAIPVEGLPAASFFELLQPFVASIGDSHSGILELDNSSTPLFLPFGTRVVERFLVVDRVTDPDLEPLMGARLVGLEGISIEEILRRQAAIRGMENQYGHLAIFRLRTLTTREGLSRVLPEWDGDDTIRIEVDLPSGNRKNLNIPLSSSAPRDWIGVPTRIDMPSTESSDVAYAFLDADRSTALLVIADLMKYREACELWLSEEMAQAEEMTRAAYEHFHHTPAPEDRESLLAGIPSATETIAALSRQMATASTRNLIVDLRGNTGGNSVMREILIYLLFGDKAMRSLDNGYEIVKLSNLLFEQYPSTSLEKINQSQPFPLNPTDFDFRDERLYRQPRPNDSPDDDLTLASSPTFWKLYRTEEFHDPTSGPSRVLVLSSPSTFSSGFNVLTGLHAMGADIVGTPSAQPGNNFGDVLQFELKNTGIGAFVSFKQIITFPDDLESGRCLLPDHPLTLEKFRSFASDPNAEVLLALEVLGTDLPTTAGETEVIQN